MITLLPAPGTYGAAVIQGLSATGGQHTRGAVLLRGAFDLVDDGSGVRQMQLSDDATRFELVPRDIFYGGGTSDLLTESDFSVEKAQTDIIVEGYMTGESGALVLVDGTIWRERDESISTAFLNADTGRNLFGWHSRTEEPRNLTSEDDDVPQNELPLGYSAMFCNTYRRSGGFSAPGLQPILPPGALVQVFQTHDASGEAYALRLPLTTYSARLRVAGHNCPDQPRRWAIAADFVLHADTLILRPDDHEAVIIWRTNWRWSDFDTARLRAVQILGKEP